MRRDECQVDGDRKRHMKKKFKVLTLSAMLFALCPRRAVS
jgi:hypothetical protein